MKVLMLVNWKIEYAQEIPKDKQPPDYFVNGIPYWFFRHFPDSEMWKVDVKDCRSFPALEKFERQKIRFYIWQTIKCLPKLNDYDMVISHGMQSGIVLCLWRRLFGKGKYRHIVFDIGAFNSARESGGLLKLMQFAGKSLDGVIYHTKSQVEYYKRCHPWLLPKSRYIPFGTDTEYFKASGLKKEKQNPYILCLGHNKRDWDTLLIAYRSLRERWNVPSCQLPSLKLIGKGQNTYFCEGVEALPVVPVQRMIQEIEHAAFCVLPLRPFNYSFGQMTLLQQMLLGKAVIAADVPSLRDYVENGRNAVLYEPGNVDVLADKMQQLILDEDLCRQIGLNATKAVRTKWNEYEMAEKIREFLITIG